jgi:O-antigen ligase
LTSPLFGIGWGHYASMSSQFAGPEISLVAHNWFVSVLAEEGAVGVALTVLLLVTLVTALRSLPKSPRSIGFAVLGAYVVGSQYLEAPTTFETSVLPILVIVAALASDWTTPPRAGRPPADEEVPAPLRKGHL